MAVFPEAMSVGMSSARQVREAWLSADSANPPDLARLLLTAAGEEEAAELIIADAEERWARRLPASLEHYQRVLPREAAKARVRRAILMCEAARRLDEPEPQVRADLASRFPALIDDVDSVLGVLTLVRSAATEAGEATSTPAISPGTRLGKYTALQRLGRGAFGEVWMARDELLARNVALKVIDALTDDASSPEARKLLAEARAAAALDHPNIIAVHDAGVFHEIGRVYIDTQLAAEEGGGVATPLDRHVESQGPMSPREAAKIMQCVAAAIGHAHASGVLHRDLKPANILLTPSGRPLVTDFGLAAAANESSDHCLRLVGTPAYMSPAQARLRPPTPLDDVFGLGATLRFLLTGSHPRGGSGVNPAEARAEVLALAASTPIPSIVTVNRQVPATLAAIVDRAVAFEPSERYQSADQLAADLGAWLHARATSARPPSRVGAFGLFLRRNTAASAVAAAAIALLSIGTAHHVRRLQSERDDALAARENAAGATQFMLDMLGAAQPGARGGVKDPKVSDVLLGASRRAATLEDRPMVEAAARHMIGYTYLALSRPADAEPHILRAMELRTSLLGKDNPDTLQTRRLHASLIYQRGRAAEALEEFAELAADAQRVLGPDDRETCSILNTLGTIHAALDHLDEAEKCQRAALDGRKRTLGPNHMDTLGARRSLAGVLARRKQFEPAITELRSVIDALERAPVAESGGPDGLFAAVTRQDLAAILRQAGRIDEAEPMLRRTVEALRVVAGPEHQNTLTAETNLAALLMRDRKRPEEALPLAQHAADSAARHLTANHVVTITARHALGDCLRALGREAEAMKAYQAALDASRRTLGAEHKETRELRGLVNRSGTEEER